MSTRRLSAPEIELTGLATSDVRWIDEVSVGRVVAGLAGFWAGREPLALIRSSGAHPLSLPTLVVHLLEFEPLIYVTAPEPDRVDYCRRAGGVLVAQMRHWGPVFALTRQRVPWWKGARDPDNLPVPDGDSRWIPRAVVHLPS
jgi:hypothetical protein